MSPPVLHSHAGSIPHTTSLQGALLVGDAVKQQRAKDPACKICYHKIINDESDLNKLHDCNYKTIIFIIIYIHVFVIFTVLLNHMVWGARFATLYHQLAGACMACMPTMYVCASLPACWHHHIYIYIYIYMNIYFAKCHVVCEVIQQHGQSNT